MRELELQVLRENYGESDTRPLDDRFAETLGVGLRDLRALRDEVDGDLSEREHGIGWWSNLPLRERVLIGDCLITCIHTIETNLVEAHLHYWEVLEWSERCDEFISRPQSAPERRFQVPQRLAPIDDLHGHMVDLHIAGVLRALGSALDCLAAVIIGTLPLKLPIMRASFARDLLDKLTALPSAGGTAAPGVHQQAEFRDAFVDELTAAGPAHWHDWIIGYRNMLVHRGRRISTNVIVNTGGSAPRNGAELVLPSEPELSQVEAWARWGNHLGCGQGSYNFSETAKETLRRAQGAVSRVVARTCELLLPLWRARRADPAMLLQPVEQWPRIPCVTPSGFGGFLPESFPVDLRTLVGSPDMVRRMKVAALDDESMHLWHQR